MAEAAPRTSIYGFELRNQFDRIKDVDDHVLFHDDLSEVATPFYLHEVAEAAARHGLQYLCDAAFSVSRFEQLPPQARRHWPQFQRTTRSPASNTRTSWRRARSARACSATTASS